MFYAGYTAALVLIANEAIRIVFGTDPLVWYVRLIVGAMGIAAALTLQFETVRQENATSSTSEAP